MSLFILNSKLFSRVCVLGSLFIVGLMLLVILLIFLISVLDCLVILVNVFMLLVSVVCLFCNVDFMIFMVCCICVSIVGNCWLVLFIFLVSVVIFFRFCVRLFWLLLILFIIVLRLIRMFVIFCDRVWMFYFFISVLRDFGLEVVSVVLLLSGVFVLGINVMLVLDRILFIFSVELILSWLFLWYSDWYLVCMDSVKVILFWVVSLIDLICFILMLLSLMGEFLFNL